MARKGNTVRNRLESAPVVKRIGDDTESQYDKLPINWERKNTTTAKRKCDEKEGKRGKIRVKVIERKSNAIETNSPFVVITVGSKKIFVKKALLKRKGN